MATHRPNEIRHALLRRLVDPGASPVAAVAEQFGVTRQAVQRHFKALLDENLIVARGKAPHRRYALKTVTKARTALPLSPPPEEDRVWESSFARKLSLLDDAAREILSYGFTEILNNAVDHSGGKGVRVSAERTPVSVKVVIEDDGVGIFRKVSDAMRLTAVDQAPLELAKGKFTTDPKRHTGEGIFFTSRAFHRMIIESDGISLLYEHREPQPLWMVTSPEVPSAGSARRRSGGTTVQLLLTLPPSRSLQDVFTAYSSGPEDYRFAKTDVPLKLAALQGDTLVSRSAAKRVLGRIDRFDEAILDFAGVRSIGQAFADEVFRVFPSQHKDVRLTPVNANASVAMMIRRALAR